MGVGLVGVGLVAFSCPILLCLISFFFFGGHNSGTAPMATAVNAGAARAGVRGGVGLCCRAVFVITLVTVAAAKSESWNTSMTTDVPSWSH